MKRDFCKLLAAAMAATTLISGCNSAQLELDSEDEIAVENPILLILKMRATRSLQTRVKNH